jgi:hypothetical protein
MRSSIGSRPRSRPRPLDPDVSRGLVAGPALMAKARIRAIRPPRDVLLRHPGDQGVLPTADDLGDEASERDRRRPTTPRRERRMDGFQSNEAFIRPPIGGFEFVQGAFDETDDGRVRQGARFLDPSNAKLLRRHRVISEPADRRTLPESAVEARLRASGNAMRSQATSRNTSVMVAWDEAERPAHGAAGTPSQGIFHPR